MILPLLFIPLVFSIFEFNINENFDEIYKNLNSNLIHISSLLEGIKDNSWQDTILEIILSGLTIMASIVIAIRIVRWQERKTQEKIVNSGETVLKEGIDSILRDMLSAIRITR